MGNELAIIKRDVVDVVVAKVAEFQNKGELQLPPDYSAANALKSAYLILQETVDKNKRPVLTTCTRDSIANALLSVAVQGLSPAKQQVYFVAYGNKLVAQRSYFGSMALAKRVDPEVAEFPAEVIYEDDVFRYEIRNGKKFVTKHEQSFQNIDKKKIIGAYCSVVLKDGTVRDTIIMTFNEIKQSWRQSKMSPFDAEGGLKETSTHGKFTSEMCKRTVINRACKPIINSSSDKTILGQVIKENNFVSVQAEMEEEVAEESNTIAIDFDEVPTSPEPDPEPVADEESPF